MAKGEGLGYLDLPGQRLKREQGRLVFGAQTPASLPVRELAIGGLTEIPEAGLVLRCVKTVCTGEIHSSLNTFFFQCENICGTITCTPRAAGDRIRLQGRGCTKKLSDLFCRTPPHSGPARHRAGTEGRGRAGGSLRFRRRRAREAPAGG